MIVDPAAQALREKIWELLRRADPESSSKAFELAAELPPPSDVADDLTAHCVFDIAFELERLGETERSLAQYRRVLSYSVENVRYPASAWFRIGVGVRRQGDYEAAIDAYRRSLALAPQIPHLEALAHFYLAELLEAAEEYQDAAISYGKTIEMLPHPDINSSKAKLGFGRCCWRIGQVDTAIRQLREIAAHGQESVSSEAWRWLAEIAEAQRDYTAAVQAYREIIASPHSEPTLRAVAAYRLGEHSSNARRDRTA